MEKILAGLDVLQSGTDVQNIIKGTIGYLGNQASVNREMENGLDVIISLFGKRVSKAFGPQHGFSSTAQDNMIETPDAVHPVYGMPIYSLYGKTRIPTDEMLEGLDNIIIDLQDAGTRVYTYIWTLFNVMEKSRGKGIRIIVPDRPNPAGGLAVQGNLPDKDYYSFVCQSDIPMRHGMTIGEMALWFHMHHFPEVKLEVIPMKGWERWMMWKDTGRDWINPSPNLPTPESCLVYPGAVLFEGTNISEGRGTTRSFELFGHPDIEPGKIKHELDKYLAEAGAVGQVLRPVYFEPAFQKFAGQVCGGFQIHITDPGLFKPWRLGQLLIRFFYEKLSINTFWNTRPYEYESDQLAIDYINGTGKIREWIENGGSPEELDIIEVQGMDYFLESRKETLLYPDSALAH